MANRFLKRIFSIIGLIKEILTKDGIIKILPDADNELVKRIKSGSIFAFSVTFAVVCGGSLFHLILLLASAIMMMEWTEIIYKIKKQDKELHKKMIFRGLVYVTLPLFSLTFIRNIHGGAAQLTWFLFTLWTVDTTSFFVGRRIGGAKLAPSISPKKTISGLIGGVFGGMMVSALLYFFVGTSLSSRMSFRPFMLITIITIILSILGDLFESFIKRHFNVKDSGQIMPGHGGLMDRLDSITFSAPFVALVVILNTGTII